MITVNGHKLNATLFPDKTSQVWQLPQWLLRCAHYMVDWRWESESEILQLAQLTQLLNVENPEGAKHIVLSVPYLPYARQDKKIRNDSTFALSMLGGMLNMMAFDKVITLDVHNEEAADASIRRLHNVPPVKFHDHLIERFQPDQIVFPDMGAYKRYPHLHDRPKLVFQKHRDEATGKITGHELYEGEFPTSERPTMLVLDDICDGGATFLSVAKTIHEKLPLAWLFLGVTHGLFSKGLLELCMYYRYVECTNSLAINPGGYGV